MKSYDLNLLRVLDAVLSAGSVSAAAERLHLSVPATSHALARLREVVGDPLLVRAGRKLVPTPRALALRDPVAQWVTQANGLLQRDKSPDLATLRRRFVIRAPEGLAIAAGGTLALHLHRELPHCTLSFVPETQDDPAALREGRVDLDVGHFQPREPEVQHVELLRQRLVAVVRRGHALAARAPSARRYASALHVAVQRRASSAPGVDEALAAQGLARQIVLTVPQANVAALIAARSELVATLGERVAQAMAPSQGLVVLPLGFVPQPESLRMAWHPRLSADPAHAWLRRSFVQALSAGAALPTV